MVNRTIILTTLLGLFLHAGSFSQEMPFVYSVENTGASWPAPYMLSIDDLPVVEELPDPFEWSDGRGRIKGKADWKFRRAEIKAEIEHYEIGEKPDRPDSITADFADGLLTVNITVNGNTLILTSPVTLPEGDGPFPAIIGIGFGGTGSLPPEIFTSRNIAQVPFNFSQVMAHTQTRGSEPINKLYPDLTYMGAYSAWSWGISRLIDGLELVADEINLDLRRLAVTGCSFAGKMALFAGAFDERIALTISQESGGGGYTTWRFSETMDGVENLRNTSSAWFIKDLFNFSNDVPKLPYDHHELMAMVAPRALFVTGNPGWVWLADESGHVGSHAAKKVWEALGVPERFGFSLIGGHNHCEVPGAQVPQIEAFVEKFLLGNEAADTDVGVSPYNPDLTPWMPWTTPILSDDSSYYGRAELVNPAREQTQLDTSLNFEWSNVEDADTYYFQLSEDPTFTTLLTADSLPGNSLNVSGLSFATQYFWRVQVKNNKGEKGPWSEHGLFATFIVLPEKVDLVSATPRRSTASNIILEWEAATGADDYLIQAAESEDFSGRLLTATTSKTKLTLTSTTEGQQYHWRVAGGQHRRIG